MEGDKLQKADIGILRAMFLIVNEEDGQTQKLVQFCVRHEVDPEEQYRARPFHR